MQLDGAILAGDRAIQIDKANILSRQHTLRYKAPKQDLSYISWSVK